MEIPLGLNLYLMQALLMHIFLLHTQNKYVLEVTRMSDCPCTNRSIYIYLYILGIHHLTFNLNRWYEVVSC